MKYLLDTHILLWSLASESPTGKQLPAAAKQIIDNPENHIFYSSINIFEIEVKRIAKPDINLPSGKTVISFCEEAGFKLLPLYDTHCLMIKTLHKEEIVKEHKDPYDWLLVSQAKSENLKFITSDNKLKHYLEDCILYVQ
jgi:PIN domain nuclease of toxin-antitoxin system